MLVPFTFILVPVPLEKKTFCSYNATTYAKLKVRHYKSLPTVDVQRPVLTLAPLPVTFELSTASELPEVADATV
jgi:hypothetical protein